MKYLGRGFETNSRTESLKEDDTEVPWTRLTKGESGSPTSSLRVPEH